MFDLSFAGAGFAGFLSFFTPCVLPMVPFYLCYLAGLSMAELRDTDGLAPGATRRLVLSTLCFAAGVTTIFVLLGMGATAVGRAFADWMDLLRWVAAAILTLFGLHFLGVLRIGLLYREARLDGPAAPRTALGAYLMGLAFGFGWTPCVGPVLASILMMASGMGEIWRGGLLLLVYGVGMTAPFVLAAMFSGAFLRMVARHRHRLRHVEQAMGAMLIVFAVLIATNSVNRIAQWMIEMFPGWVALT